MSADGLWEYDCNVGSMWNLSACTYVSASYRQERCLSVWDDMTTSNFVLLHCEE